MKRGHSHDVVMTEGTIWKQLLLFSVPLLIGNLFQQLYNTVDTIVVGNYIGSSALAAVSSSNSLINLIIGLFIGIATGAGVVISQFYGGRRERELSQAVHTSITLAMIGGVILIGLGILLSPVLLRMMGTPEDVMPNSILYFRIYFCGSLFNLVYNMGAGILRAVGDSRRPLYYLCAASIVNIVLDLLFVAGFGMGVEGVGIATVLAQMISAVLVVLALNRSEDSYRLDLKKLRVDKRMMVRILKMGIPSGLQTCVISLSNVVIQANINSFGATAMAGCGSYMKVDGFVVMPITSFGLASMTFTGQNIGARKYDRVKKGVVVGAVMSLIYSATISILLFFFGSHILQIFSRDAEVISYGMLMLHVLVPFYWMLAIAQSLTGSFRGAGKSFVAMLIMVGNMCGLRMLWVNILTPITGQLSTVLLGYPVSWLTTVIVSLLYLWKGNWLRHYMEESGDRIPHKKEKEAESSAQA
ncbi:MATE family efflux transporter [Anaerolentibacter hominis]|uniref:MATE family efflux transporter n=1 Tax=Anaerolentibacter hominis TaxID=3079009 RepID=UPI0031B7F8BE